MSQQHDFITADGVNHGKSQIEDCMGAVIDRCEDGYVHCVLLWSGATCEECFEQFERWEDK